MVRLRGVTDGGAGNRARIGLVVLHVDETIETEMKQLLDVDGVAVHVTRVESGADLDAGTLEDSLDRIPGAVRLLPPDADMDAVGYACTSGAAVLGSERVARAIRGARPEASVGTFMQTPVTDPLTALLAACQHLGVRRLGFVTPYIASVSQTLRQSMERGGLQIAAFGSFEEARESRVARISPASTLEAALRVGRGAPCDAVFISCTNLRTLQVLAPAEKALGVPVLSSNQVLAWHLRQLVGLPTFCPGVGCLMGT